VNRPAHQQRSRAEAREELQSMSTNRDGDGVLRARSEVLAAVDRLRDLLWARDPSIVEEFADSPDVLLVGSDDGEIARGRAEIESLLRALFELPVRLRWEWRHRDISVAGDIAWLFADCEVVIASDQEEKRKPYRLTGVLQRVSGNWRWRQFHGSQPN
jgi:ketosteroid isomerase-like protein